MADRRSMRYVDSKGRPQVLTWVQSLYLAQAERGLARGWGGLDSTLVVRLLEERGLITLARLPWCAWKVSGRTKLGDAVWDRWNEPANA